MAAGLGAKTLQEYLVSLGVKLDEKGMTKMEGFLKSSKLGLLALAGVMVTAATVATKWVKQINENELALAKEAKAQHKSIEAVRASENALKAMGKTKQEIAKDKSLKAVYDDLVKMNKAMALPEGSRGLSLVRSIRDEFIKFKSTIQYAMQWVNYHIISKLEGPLTRIRNTMKAWREKLTTEMPYWTAKIADGITVLVRLLETAVRFGGNVIKFIQKLPTELKVMGTAIYGLWNIIRAGPLGWLLGGLTALLLLLDDFYAYQRGEPSALAGLWEGLDDGTFGNKLTSIAQSGIDELVKFLSDPKTQESIKAAFGIIADIALSALTGAIKIFMNFLPKNVQDFLGWDPSLDNGTGNWKDSKSGQTRTVVTNGEEVDVGVGETVPSKYQGVVYRNRNGILEPVLSPEYKGMDYDTEVPEDIKESLMYLRKHFWDGGEPLLEIPEYNPRPYTEDEKAQRENSAYEMLKGMLQGTQSDADLEHSTFYKNLKDAFGIEQGLLDNGETSQEYFKGITDALLKGAVQDYIASMSPYGSSQNGYQYSQWYEAYKKGTLVPDGAALTFDSDQVEDATSDALDTAQKAVKPITVPMTLTLENDNQDGASDPNSEKTRNAQGGRYDTPTETTLVEDGDTEYVIPIKKLSRAIPLIRMMLAEIGDKGRQMLSGLGITPDTDINQFVASKGLGMPGGGSPVINIVNNNTVNAPATIIVNGAGQDPQAVGQAAYNAQERFLVRTLKAVVQSE